MHTTPAPAPKPEAEPETDLTPDAAMVHIKAVRRVKRIEAELTMLIAQTKALETLMHCMTPVQSTGDTRRDAAHARERNRQRLAATQTLLHIRTVQREQRLRRTMSDKAKAKAERWQPSAASDAVQEQKRKAPSPPASPKGGVVRSEADGHADNGTKPSAHHGRRPVYDRRQPTPPPPPDPAPPMLPSDARYQQLKRLRAEKMAKQQSDRPGPGDPRPLQRPY